MSESKGIVHQNHVDPAGVPAEPGDQELAADGVRALAVHAFAGLCAGGGKTETLGIGGRGHIAGALHGAVQVTADLIHAHDEEHLLRPLADGGDTVGVPVDIDEDPVIPSSVMAFVLARKTSAS